MPWAHLKVEELLSYRLLELIGLLALRLDNLGCSRKHGDLPKVRKHDTTSTTTATVKKQAAKTGAAMVAPT